MHTFTIVRRQRDWAVHLGQAVTAPCKSRATAIEQAERMAEAIRRHGGTVAVVIDHADVSPEAKYLARPPKGARIIRAQREPRRGRKMEAAQVIRTPDLRITIAPLYR